MGPGFCVAFLALVETSAEEGGRRRGAKRPEIAWPGAFDPGPRYFVWLAGGAAPQGRPPRPPNAAAPPVYPPRPSCAPRRDRRIALGRPLPPARALPLGRGGGGVPGPGLSAPAPERARCRAQPGSGRVGAAHPPPPPAPPRPCGRPAHTPRAIAQRFGFPGDAAHTEDPPPFSRIKNAGSH